VRTGASIFLISLLLTSGVQAAELKPETLKAWDQYVEDANAHMQERLRDGGKFLWMDEAGDREKQVRQGKIVVAPMTQHTPMRVPNGLIHHWIGLALLPNAKIDDVFSVVRDYRRYKEFYAPTVIDSKPVRQTEAEDQFAMVLMNKSFLMKRALDSEYQSTYTRIDAKRWYSTSYTTRVQEIEDYGQANEHRLPLNEGSGYIWRLYGITRFQETEGGVYVEVEGMALSRDIPGAVRLVVDPIVRRVSKGSVMTSIKQTQDAISNASAAGSGSKSAQASAGAKSGSASAFRQ
jgi:hypothetical protein